MTDRPYILWPPDWHAIYGLDAGGPKATKAADAYFDMADSCGVLAVGMPHRDDVRLWLAPIYAAGGMPRSAEAAPPRPRGGTRRCSTNPSSRPA